MIEISNADYAIMKRVLNTLSSRTSTPLKRANAERQARLLLKKFNRLKPLKNG